MEASENVGAAPEEQAPEGEASQPTVPGTEIPPSQASAFPGVAEGDREAAENRAVEGPADEELSEEDRNPAADQAPTATEAQDAIIGDPGLRDEQQPQQSVGSADIPHRTSPPPPAAQSGVPLPEDRAAGIEPGTKGPVVPVNEDAEGELPEHDASEGQSTTPPLGG